MIHTHEKNNQNEKERKIEIKGIDPSKIFCVFHQNDESILELYFEKDECEKRVSNLNIKITQDLKLIGKRKKHDINIPDDWIACDYVCKSLLESVDLIKDGIIGYYQSMCPSY